MHLFFGTDFRGSVIIRTIKEVQLRENNENQWPVSELRRGHPTPPPKTTIVLTLK